MSVLTRLTSRTSSMARAPILRTLGPNTSRPMTSSKSGRTEHSMAPFQKSPPRDILSRMFCCCTGVKTIWVLRVKLLAYNASLKTNTISRPRRISSRILTLNSCWCSAFSNLGRTTPLQKTCLSSTMEAMQSKLSMTIVSGEGPLFRPCMLSTY